MTQGNRKVAVVTGAGKGIGRALADVLFERDYEVVPVVRTIADVKHFEESYATRMHPVRADVTERSTEAVLREFVESRFDKIDLLVNNAGHGATAYGIESLRYEELDAVLAVHCYGPIRCTRACLPLLRKSPAATIINMSSRFGSVEWVATKTVPADQATYAYRIAKAAMNMLTSCLAVELESDDIKVLAVDPGKVKTRFGPKDADVDPEASAQAILDLAEKRIQTATFVQATSGEKVPW